jgi:hypothetical protein
MFFTFRKKCLQKLGKCSQKISNFGENLSGKTISVTTSCENKKILQFLISLA